MEQFNNNSEDPKLIPDPGGREPDDFPAEKLFGRQLSEPGRFAYAGLCGVSLGQLFQEPEQKCFREKYLESLIRWLNLDESVMPVMQAFLAGHGFEGTDTFLSIINAEPLLRGGAFPITQDLVSFSVKDGHYDARARVLIRHVRCLLRVSQQQLEDFEETLGEKLREAEEESEEESSRRQKKERGRKLRRYLLIGLATVGGGTVIGVTGGLAAPLVAAGAGAVLGAGGAAALGSAAGIAIMASLFGAAGAGLTGYKMNKRVGAIEEFEFLPLSSGKHLHVTIAVTGWLCTGKYSSFQAPWSSLGACGEQYCLKWESRYLLDLGSILDSLWDGLVGVVAQEALKYTVLAGILTALTWPASLLAVASVIDNPWGVCLSRSAAGKRPVSLIGFSLGARVIYFCLEELANDQGSEGVVEDVVMLGAPVDGSEKVWRRLSKVVAGKIVNGYCRGDWLLGYLYRSSSVQMCVAGLQPINSQGRKIINVDLSSVVKGHLDYMRQMDTILVAVGVPTREEAGATSGQSQLDILTQEKSDTPGSVPDEVKEEPTIDTSNRDSTETSFSESINHTGEKGSGKKTDSESGWDIPDISDLLDSLNDCDDVSDPCQRIDRSTCALGAEDRFEQKQQSTSCPGSDTDCERTSWDWDDTQWTTERSTTSQQSNSEAQDQ
ncbi:Transmembrane and coiled-coil domain-containing protein 4 [Triplophysa tibetana]|uniref:Transmembrane and coiled-coil domain-containing protein 4 n=1 Tax=Triplophysa tibetana TaxID=1572043 RepID=A0A5A9NA40_9TELE|nr:Transmembrane and coiled-coil domain-containing protein 4 [Triplophysa tibetana]